MMDDFTEYLVFIQRFNPSHKFSDEELEFLRNDFEDLKTFVEELGAPESKQKTVNFEDVLQDELFFYQDNLYVKINDKKGRIFQGREVEQFGKLNKVEITSSTKS